MSIVDVAVIYSNYYPDIYSGLLNYDEMFQINVLQLGVGCCVLVSLPQDSGRDIPPSWPISILGSPQAL